MKRDKWDHGIGCAGTVAGLNLMIMGLLALTFTRGPYFSSEQALWYRGGSLAFLVFGALLPIAALTLSPRRSPFILGAITWWMGAALLAFVGYVFLSGGGA